MNNILVLSTDDNPAEGHAYSRYLYYKNKGENAFFLPLIRQYTDTDNYFIDARDHYTFKRKVYAFMIRVHRYLILKRNKREYCFFNILMRGKRASQILEKVPFVPDIIIVGWCDGYITSKTISDLYRLTKAKIVIPMIDAHLLGGGCHYPCGCNQFHSGCMNCPALRIKSLARWEYNQKCKYLGPVPFVFCGTSYDLKRAADVPFLSNKETITTIGVPRISINISKAEARSFFDLSGDDFVIMFGAVNVFDKRKGFDVLIKSLKLLSSKVGKEKSVTLLVLGNLSQNIIIEGLKVKATGFLCYEDMMKAYYASDVFVSPSLDDSGPYMVNYSVACGCPVVSFPIGIAMDLVIPERTGYLARFNDADDFCRGLELFYNMEPQEIGSYSQNCKELMSDLAAHKKPWYDEVID